MLEYRALSKVYPDGTRAVDSLDLKIAKGEIIVLIGPSGCGKTTLLKMTNHLEKISSGNILLNGRDITSYDPVKLRRGIGYVIQENGLMPHLTAAENIATVPRLLKWKTQDIHRRVDELLELAGLDPAAYRNRLPSQMSGGQQQRIGVLRGLAAEPDLVLMDEPFGALDPITKDKLQGELLELQSKMRKTILFVTHDIDEAFKLADRIVLMRKGRIEQLASPEELQNNPKNDFVRNFIGSDRLSQISPEASVQTLLEDAPLILNEFDTASTILERMEDTGIDTAQILTKKGLWLGMAHLKTVKSAAKASDTVREAIQSDRKLYASDATIRDAAEMLADEESPVPVLDEDHKLLGQITESGIARLTISRLTRGSKGGEA